VIDDPSAYVDGLTLTQWTEQWYRWADPSPGGNIDAFNDPNGTVAQALNLGYSPMYFITQQGGGDASAIRSFSVPLGESVLVPIVGVADSEGPAISPTDPAAGPPQGTYANEVKAVLAAYTFAGGSYRLDGGKTVNNVPVVNSGIFDAGFAPPGSAGADNFEVTGSNGTELRTTGEAGYWVILTGLSLGQHTLTANGTINFPGGSATINIHDNINVVL
jgi:hypothetical protein